MSWSTVFPILTKDHLDDYQREATVAEKRELDVWFGVKRKFNSQTEKSELVAFSLFWKNATAGSPELPPPTRERMLRADEFGLVERFHPWRHYVKPLLDHLPGLVERHPGVAFRVYLASDLDFLIEEFVAMGCEVYWMKHPSLRYCPGGLWRFLAYGERGKLVTVSDSDRIGDLDTDIERTRALATTGHGAWRVPLTVDFTVEGNVSYCPFMGGQSGVKGGLSVARLMKAFVWHSRRGTFEEVCEVPGCGPRRARGTRWPDYWFDQWFLTAAVYPRIAPRGMISFVSTSARSFLLPLDIEYAMWANPRSEIVYFRGKNCCGEPSANKRDGESTPRLSPELVRETRPFDPMGDSPVDSRVALLFLTRGDVNHPEIWQEYLDDLGSRGAVYSHPKSVDAQRGGFLEGTAIDNRIPTHWGDISLVRATLALLETAAVDRSITHFMLLSESCIPIRPADELLRALEMDPRPRLGFESHAQLERRNPDKAGRIFSGRDVPAEHWYFHDQWMLLDRRAVAALLQEDMTDRFEGVFAADESYFGSVLSMSGWNMATDIVGRCPTWTRWEFDGAGPTNHTILNGSAAADMVESGRFFARKFPPHSDVKKWHFHRPDSRIPVPPTSPRPASCR